MVTYKNNYMTEKRFLVYIILFGFFGHTTAQLNDTGQIACANEFTVQLECNDLSIGTDVYSGQDAERGLDAELFNPDDGLGGFSFTKLDSMGDALADQQLDYDTMPWSCVQDNVTGLVWEVKTDDGGVHDRDWSYSWYNSTGINDGGGAGVENSGLCVDNINCDTEKFITAVNAENLCGFVDWRLPNPSELLSIVVFNPIPFADQTFPIPPTIDTDFFPNSLRADYWTASTTATSSSSAQVIYFGGNTDINPKSFAGALRTVRGQTIEPLTVFPAISNSTGSQVCNAELSNSAPDDRFELLDDGLVKDLFTDLIWPRCPQGYSLSDNGTSELADDSCAAADSTEHTWQEALENATAANNAVQMGFADWRVPNIKELFSIKETACEFPAINGHVFPAISVNRTWSSTANDVGTAEYLDFNNGDIRTASQQTPYTLRLVGDSTQPPINDVIFEDGFE